MGTSKRNTTTASTTFTATTLSKSEKIELAEYLLEQYKNVRLKPNTTITTNSINHNSNDDECIVSSVSISDAVKDIKARKKSRKSKKDRKSKKLSSSSSSAPAPPP